MKLLPLAVPKLTGPRRDQLPTLPEKSSQMAAAGTDVGAGVDVAGALVGVDVAGGLVGVDVAGADVGVGVAKDAAGTVT